MLNGICFYKYSVYYSVHINLCLSTDKNCVNVRRSKIFRDVTPRFGNHTIYGTGKNYVRRRKTLVARIQSDQLYENGENLPKSVQYYSIY